MGSGLGQRASKSACFVVPGLLGADIGTNLSKQRGNVKGRLWPDRDSNPGPFCFFFDKIFIIFSNWFSSLNIWHEGYQSWYVPLCLSGFGENISLGHNDLMVFNNMPARTVNT